MFLALGWTTPDKTIAFKCGGSLISDKFILTVAHCAEDYKWVSVIHFKSANWTSISRGNQPTVVRLGDQNLLKDDDGAQPVEYKVWRVIKHKNYVHNLKKNDIALIELDQTVIFTKFIRPACLNKHENVSGFVTAVSHRFFFQAFQRTHPVFILCRRDGGKPASWNKPRTIFWRFRWKLLTVNTVHNVLRMSSTIKALTQLKFALGVIGTKYVLVKYQLNKILKTKCLFSQDTCDGDRWTKF